MKTKTLAVLFLVALAGCAAKKQQVIQQATEECNQARDAALTTASAELKFISGISLAATFDGEFSNVTRSCAGKGVARYQW